MKNVKQKYYISNVTIFTDCTHRIGDGFYLLLLLNFVNELHTRCKK